MTKKRRKPKTKTKPNIPAYLTQFQNYLFPQFDKPIVDPLPAKPKRDLGRDLMKQRLFMEHYGASPDKAQQGTDMHKAIEDFFAAYPKLRTTIQHVDPKTGHFDKPITSISTYGPHGRGKTIDAIQTPLVFDCMDCAFLNFSMTEAQRHMANTTADPAHKLSHSIDVRFASQLELETDREIDHDAAMALLRATAGTEASENTTSSRKDHN